MTVIYNRDQAVASVKKAFETTRALKLNHSDHNDNLVVEVYDKLPAGLGQNGTLAAFIDGYCMAARHAMQVHELDFVYRAGIDLFGGWSNTGFSRRGTDMVQGLDPDKIEVAYLWRFSDTNFTEWLPLSAHLPKVQP